MPISIDNIESALADVFPQQFEDTLSRESRAYNLIPKKDPPDRQGPRWKAKVAGYTAENWAVGAAFQTPGTITEVPASLEWGQFEVTFQIPGKGLDMLDQGSPLLIANYLQEHTQDGIDAMIAKLDAGVLGGVQTNGFVGLQVAIDSAGTYANIARGTFPTWASYQNDAAGVDRDITADLLETTYTNFVDTNKAMWTGVEVWIAPTPAGTLAKITTGGGVPSLQQVAAPSLATLQTVGLADLNGIQGVFKQAPIRKVSGMEANTCYFLRPGMDKIHIQELRRFRMSTPVRPPGQDDWFFDLTHIAQLVNPNPKKNGAVLEDVK
jgi:hypothetical protein